MVVPVLYNNGKKTTDFEDCTIKKTDKMQMNTTKPNLQSNLESILVSFSEDVIIPQESRHNIWKHLINMLMVDKINPNLTPYFRQFLTV